MLIITIETYISILSGLCSNSLQSYNDVLSGLDKIVRRMILESFGLEKYMDEQMNCSEYSLRFHKYDGIQSHEKAHGLKTHVDQSFLTVLQQSRAKGLEVLTKDGEWITPEWSLDSFVVMIGDSFRVSVFIFNLSCIN